MNRQVDGNRLQVLVGPLAGGGVGGVRHGAAERVVLGRAFHAGGPQELGGGHDVAVQVVGRDRSLVLVGVIAVDRHEGLAAGVVGGHDLGPIEGVIPGIGRALRLHARLIIGRGGDGVVVRVVGRERGQVLVGGDTG